MGRTPEQINAINRLRTIQPRVGRERILERGGRADRNDDMPELGDVATGLIRKSARGESSAQTIQGQQLTPPMETEGNPAQTLVPESRAGEFRPMEQVVRVKFNPRNWRDRVAEQRARETPEER